MGSVRTCSSLRAFSAHPARPSRSKPSAAGRGNRPRDCTLPVEWTAACASVGRTQPVVQTWHMPRSRTRGARTDMSTQTDLDPMPRSVSHETAAKVSAEWAAAVLTVCPAMMASVQFAVPLNSVSENSDQSCILRVQRRVPGEHGTSSVPCGEQRLRKCRLSGLQLYSPEAPLHRHDAAQQKRSCVTRWHRTFFKNTWRQWRNEPFLYLQSPRNGQITSASATMMPMKRKDANQHCSSRDLEPIAAPWRNAQKRFDKLTCMKNISPKIGLLKATPANWAMPSKHLRSQPQRRHQRTKRR